MTDMLVPIETPRRRALLGRLSRVPALSLGVAALALAVLAAPALASPLPMESPADISAFIARLQMYSGANRVRWIIGAHDSATAEAKIAEIKKSLPLSDLHLADLLRAQALPDQAIGASPAVVAWIQPQMGAPNGAPACSWQVWVTDPALPSPREEAIAVPLDPNDRLPVSRAATFRVGHTGLLQSKLYAFDETRPGAIRDLATADVNVPVPTEKGEDTIFLAMARLTAPFLENLKSALADSNGKRRDLGAEFALHDKAFGPGRTRGIGGNIQTIPPNMITPRRVSVPPSEADKPSPDASSLMETCTYALVPTP